MDILIVEDEAKIAELIELYLSKEGFNCHICRDGNTALERFKAIQPDLMILDLMLPGLDGLEVCARIRQQSGHPSAHQAGVKDPYIMMLTAKGEELDRIIGLSTGADDYMVKPFSPRELVARVRAVLRRSLRQGGQTVAPRTYQTAHFTIDIDRRVALYRPDGAAQTAARTYERLHAGPEAEDAQNGPKTDRPHKNVAEPRAELGSDMGPEITSDEITLELTPLEFDLLSTFMSYPGRVWNRGQLIEKLWGNDFFGDERVVDTHIARLRKKVEHDSAAPSFIKTVVGVGYRFEDEVN
ncbi:MAG: response regulator transcription factor [Cyanobacteria bacterium P01_F01_bin.53]